MIEDKKPKYPRKEENLLGCRIRINTFVPRTDKSVNLLERILGDLHGIFWICAHSLGSIKTDDFLNEQQISPSFLSNKSYSTIFV